MTQRFGDGARRLAGGVCRVLGWPPHWFWAATPDEITAIFAEPQSPQSGVSRADLDRMMEHENHG